MLRLEHLPSPVDHPDGRLVAFRRLARAGDELVPIVDTEAVGARPSTEVVDYRIGTQRTIRLDRVGPQLALAVGLASVLRQEQRPPVSREAHTARRGRVGGHATKCAEA